jgi:Tfp pilus assembly protein PilF
MDGQLFRKFWLSSCLILGTLGCNRNSIHAPWGSAPSAQSISGVPMGSGSKPFWGGNPSVAVPVEIGTDSVPKGPPKPETEVAIADVRLEAAFDENTAPSNREGLLDLARQGYQKALKQDPKNKAAMLGLARYYSRLGERDKALEMYQRYLARNPNDREVLHEVALAHARWKDWDGAVSWCERALQVDPENLSFRKTMGFCLARGGYWDRSYQVFCQIMPEAQARYNLACVLAHQHQPEASKQQLLLAIKADPNYAPAREALAQLEKPTLPAADPNPIQRAGYVPMP